jgi:urea carboxylase
MFSKVLIANRGAIACRVIRTLKKLGIASVAVYSEADANSLHVSLADEAVCIGPAPAAESYLKADTILEAARATGAQGIHPGYGFLSENPAFSDACEAAGIAFIGPTRAQMLAFGLKHTARELAEQAGVPLLPGSGLLDDVAHARLEAARIGYPVMLKSTAGGGGIGMRLIGGEAELDEAYASVDRLARANFKEAGIYLEKYVTAARHIEVQVFGDGQGRVLALGERDCSVQRRNQKVIEETPAPGLTAEQRASLAATAVRLMESIAYRSAGTVEFVMDADSGAFYFLEVNTRLQVEHGVTEEVTGTDLVEWMVLLASGDLRCPPPRRSPGVPPSRCASTPKTRPKTSSPRPACSPKCVFPRACGSRPPSPPAPRCRPTTTPWWPRSSCTRKPAKPPPTNSSPPWTPPACTASRPTGPTCARSSTARCSAPGARPPATSTASTTAPVPLTCWKPACRPRCRTGRAVPAIGTWACPPPAPMDDLALRAANRLVGNPEGAAGLECTMTGPTLRFNCDAVIALTGAPTTATLDGEPLAFWQAHAVKAGAVLKIGAVKDAGCRSYLAVAGGIDVPDYLGSKSTFTLGQFGGHAGRCLRLGDVLAISPTTALPAPWHCSRPAIATIGKWRCSTAPMARRTSSPIRTSPASSPPTGRSTTTPAAPAYA